MILKPTFPCYGLWIGRSQLSKTPTHTRTAFSGTSNVSNNSCQVCCLQQKMERIREMEMVIQHCYENRSAVCYERVKIHSHRLNSPLNLITAPAPLSAALTNVKHYALYYPKFFTHTHIHTFSFADCFHTFTIWYLNARSSLLIGIFPKSCSQT